MNTLTELPAGVHVTVENTRTGGNIYILWADDAVRFCECATAEGIYSTTQVDSPRPRQHSCGAMFEPDTRTVRTEEEVYPAAQVLAWLRQNIIQEYRDDRIAAMRSALAEVLGVSEGDLTEAMRDGFPVANPAPKSRHPDWHIDVVFQWDLTDPDDVHTIAIVGTPETGWSALCADPTTIGFLLVNAASPHGESLYTGDE